MDFAHDSRRSHHLLPWGLVTLLVLAMTLPIAAAAQEYLATGTYQGDGSALRAITEVGFTPDVVIIKGVKGDHSAIRTSTMPDGFSALLGDAKPLEAKYILSLDPDGFTIDDNHAVNEAGFPYYWVAMKSGTSQVFLGSYQGDGVTYREYNGLGFQPAAALIISDDTKPAVLRTDRMSPGLSYPLRDGPPLADAILEFGPDGFILGVNDAVNKPGVDMHFVVWPSIEGSVSTGVYAGNDQDGRWIAGIGLQPEYLMIRGNVDQDGLHRMASVTGDSTLFFRNQPAAENLIEALTPGGFQVGSDKLVNASGSAYYWLGFANPAPATDLSLAAGADVAAPNAGESVVFDFTVKNLGPTDATGVLVRAPLPPGLSFQQGLADAGTYDPDTGVWTLGDLAVGGTARLDLTAVVDPGTGGTTLTMGGKLEAAFPTEADLTDNESWVQLDVPSADLTVAAVVSDASPDVGETVVFTLAITNAGPDEATGVVASGSLPAGLGFQTAMPSAGGYDPGTGEWTLGILPAASTATLTLLAVPEAGSGGRTLATHFGIAEVDQEDPDPTNDDRLLAVTVTLADLALAKTVDVASPDEGAAVTFTITVANLGPNQATGVRVEDVLPTGLTFDSWATATGDFDEGMGWWNLGAVAAGDTAVLALTALVEPGTGGETLTNRAVIERADQEDPAAGNDQDEASVTVSSTDLMVQKTVDNPSPNEGDRVTFTIVLANLGPNDATGVSLTDTLPAGLQLASASAGRGVYDPAGGLWTLGGMAVGATDTLVLQGDVLAGTAGTSITNRAWVQSVDQKDPVAANDSSFATVTVASTDLRLTKTVDEASPNEGDTVTFKITLTNAGPNGATGIVVEDPLPTGLTLQGSSATLGSFDEITAMWSLAAVAPGDTASLSLVAGVDPGTAGNLITNTASIIAADLADADPSNDTASAGLVVSSTDVQVTKSVDDPTPDVGGSVAYTVAVSNQGPNEATGVIALDLLPGGLTLQGAVVERGTYTAANGWWDIGALAVGDTVTLTLNATVDASAAGANIVNTAAVTAVDQTDLNADNDAAAVAIDVAEIPDTPEVALTMLPGSPSPALPGASATPVLSFELVNRGNEPDTLRSLAVTNLTTGPGSPSQAVLDAEWGVLTVYGQRRGLGGTDPAEVLPSRDFTSGRADFSGFTWIMGSGDTLAVTVEAAPSLAARDGAALTVGLADPGDLGVRQTVVFDAGFPAVSGHELVVDGMVADQVTLTDVPSGTVPVATARNLAFVFDLPGNGYLDDSLYGLTLANRGSATPGGDISRMEFWTDDGDGTFDPALDANLGEIVHSGELWQVTGLDVTVPATGRRFFVTVDIAEAAMPAREISLELPVEHGDAVIMASGNDGLRDRALVNGGVLAITVDDRLILTTETIDPAPVAPDARAVPLLSLNVANTYTSEKRLESVTVTNSATVDPTATPGERDAIVRQVVLRRDGDGDGLIDDVLTDPALGSGAFVGGRVTFSGLDLPVTPGGFERLFVTADADPSAVADGDILAAVIADGGDIWVPDATLVASWPLDSGAAWTTDGMVVAQVASAAVPGRTLGPADGPELALDLVIPANGYLPDRLLGLAVDNTRGTAGPADLAQVRLWADDGDGAFDALADLELGAMNWLNGRWVSPVLNRDVPVGGARYFVSVTAAVAPADSGTIRFAVPVDGIVMQSSNSGPVDGDIPPGGTLVLSTSALVGRLDFDSGATSTGQTGTLRMTVRNVGAELVTGITPDVSVLAGDASITLGPGMPATFDLVPDGSADFTWDYTATGAGTLVMVGSAAGRGDVTGLDHAAAPTPSAEHRVHTAVPRLDTYPTASLPKSVARDAADLVALNLTLVNPGDVDVAEARLDSVRIRLAETPDGPAIVPAELIEQVVLSEGSDVYVTETVLPTSGDTFILRLSPPALITGSEPVTLGLRIDLRADSTAPSFVMIIDDGGSFHAVDVVSGFPVPAVLGRGAFPIVTRQADLVSPSGGLAVTVAPDSTRAVEPGQAGVHAATLTLRNDSTDPTSSPIRIRSLGFVPRDAAGASLPDPGAVFSGLILEGPTQDYFTGAPQVTDSLVVMMLSPPLEVPVGQDVSLVMSGDLGGAVPFGMTWFDFTADGPWSAEDAGDGSVVPLLVTPSDPVAGFAVVAPVTEMTASGVGLLPTSVALGSRDLAALNLKLVHPGTGFSAVAAWDSLVLNLFDENRDPLDPAGLLDRVRVMAAETTLGALVDPADPDGRLALDLAAPFLAAGDTLDVTVSLDVRPDAGLVSFELIAAPSGIVTRDTVSGERPTLATTGVWPVWSGRATIVVAAEELTVDGESLMPALLAPQSDYEPVLRLVLANPASAGSGPLAVSSLTLGPAAEDNDFALPGAAVRGLAVAVDAGELARNDSVAADADVLTVTLPDPILIPAGESREIELLLGVRSDAPAGRLRLALEETGVSVGPPGAPPGGIRILPAAGRALPLETEIGNVGPASLADSYINYPNPFAAGREQTTFAYYLLAPARVSLRLLTPHGESVATVIEGETRDPGLHQDDTWNGLNGRGSAVRNGVYIAELVVEFTDGSRERVLRKVAVVR